MRFEPKTEQQIRLDRLLPEGFYPFQVINAEDCVSSKGNEMIRLTVKVFNDNSEVVVNDYLLSAMAKKLRHFSYATGLEDFYDSGSIESHNCIGRSGELEIKIEEGKPRPEGGNYPEKNYISDYVVKKNEQKKSEQFIDDDISF